MNNPMTEWLKPLTRMVSPLVNPNGSDPDTMVADRIEVLKALSKIHETLAKTKPHGRDYLGRMDIYERDRSIYDQRFAALDALYNSIRDEALIIQNR